MTSEINVENVYSTPPQLAAFFTKQHGASFQIFLVGTLVLLAAIVYESLRIRDLGFEVTRLPVYVIVLPFMVFSFICLPIRNRGISGKVIVDLVVADGEAVVTTLAGKKMAFSRFSIKNEVIFFYGDTY